MHAAGLPASRLVRARFLTASRLLRAEACLASRLLIGLGLEFVGYHHICICVIEGSDAIVLPGSGFLSENADFAQAVGRGCWPGLDWSTNKRLLQKWCLNHQPRDIATKAGVCTLCAWYRRIGWICSGR
jgi:hypothetical protein